VNPLESIESAAWAQQYAGLDPDLRAIAVPLGGLHVFGVGAWPDSPWHNVVTGLGPDEPSLGAALALLAKLGAQRPVLQVVDGAVDESVLTSRGFVVGHQLVRLSAPTRPAEPHPKVRVISPAQGSTVAAVCLKGFGQVDQRWWRAGLAREGWTQVVAFDGDVAVGTGALFVEGDEAWIGSATTVPEARGRGVHAALLSTRAGLAAAQGATRVSVKSVRGSAAYRGLVRAGFTESHGVTQWRATARTA
jgi:GNAT superfamily N-acetyltransferase